MRSVSIVIPCYNEETHIASLLEAILAQDYPLDRIEVVIADGLSTDRTREVVQAFSALHPSLSLHLIINTKRSIPSAVNAAVAAARGDLIVRLDGHSHPYPDYVGRCVSALEAGAGENVGGVWEIRPGANGWIPYAISVAAAHPLGVGDARYRHASTPAYVDTVPFGAYSRGLFEQLGGYDETLLTNEDYEFNVRIRQARGRIWLDPRIRSIYYARETLGALARQYWRYGYWKYRMLRRYPSTLRWRQALPPLLVLSLAFGLTLAWIPAVGTFFLLELLVYLLALAAAAIVAAARHSRSSLLVGLPLAVACMHLSWGAGFLWSMIAARVSPRS